MLIFKSILNIIILFKTITTRERDLDSVFIAQFLAFLTHVNTFVYLKCWGLAIGLPTENHELLCLQVFLWNQTVSF